MNFLAHLHIAEHCDSHYLGNLLGDFVKGNPDTHYDLGVANGIRLHRFVDKITDHHALVEECKALFTEGRTRRFAPIALDMFWDHCLAKQFSQFSTMSLPNFVDQAEHKVSAELRKLDCVPEAYQQLHNVMWPQQWMLSYQDFDNIGYALEKMSLRRPRFGELKNTYSTLETNYDTLSAIFPELYRDVLDKSLRFHRDNQAINQ